MARRHSDREKEKTRGLLSILAICAVVLVAVGALTFGGKLKPVMDHIQGETGACKSPSQLLKQYYAYIEDGNYEGMYEMLDETCKANILLETFTSRNQNIYEGIGAENFQLNIQGEKEETSGEIVVSYQVKMDTVAGQLSFSNQTSFQREPKNRGSYRLHWEDCMIFPDLTSNDKVQVTTNEAKRGRILDRNGVVLAGEGTASSVGLVPGQMSESPQKDIRKLAEILKVSEESIQNKLEASWVKSDSFVPIQTVEKLTELEQMEQELSEETKEKMERDTALLEIPGVMITDVMVRQYPLGEAASHLIGYIQQVTAEDLEEHAGEGYSQTSMIGRSGMESLYEKELKGKDGCQIVIVDGAGKTKSLLASTIKEDGKDIRLTIDARLQQAIYDVFAEDESCSVAMQPYTGEVLALVSTPTYDGNDFVMGMSDALWNSLNEDEGQPFYNRFRQKLCPGSSLKPIIAAIGLKTGAIDPQNDYGSEGLRWQKDSSWGDYYVTTLHESNPATLQNALIYSDNIYFAKAALRIGQKTLEAELQNLGFQEKLSFEITVEKSQYSNGEHIESEIQLADSGYGQGQILVNPIHLASLYTGFANEGDVIKPYLRYREEAKAQIWMEKAYAPEDAVLIEQYMEQVLESPEGTGHGAYREDVPLAGKTGTAEIKLTTEDQSGTELGWFGVFTPDPETQKPLLLLSMVEDVKELGGSGYVVDKDRQVLDQWFRGIE